MSKPDWAERLQRTFQRKYDRGFIDGNAKGYGEGFEAGAKKAIAESRKVFVKRIQKELQSAQQNGNIEYVNGLNKAIELINRRK